MMLSYHYAIEFAKEQKEVFGGDMRAFLDAAIECIEKQIPKKYTTKESHWKGKRIISCPVCSHAFESYFTKDSLSKEAAIWSASCVNKFCPWCGQKIDWSETDD